MSDPYREATRGDAGGRFTLSRGILLTGAAIGALLVAVVVWFAVSDRSVDQSPEAVAELNYRQATVRAAAAAAVLRAPEPRTGLRVDVARGLADVRQLETAMVEVLGSILEDEGYTVTPVDEGSDLGLRIEHQSVGRTRSIRMRPVSDKLVSVAQGGARLLDTTPRVVSWVPLYPGAQRFVVSGSHTVGSVNYMGFVVKAGAEEIVDWYEDVAKLIERNATDPHDQAATRVTTVRMGPDGRIRERFAMKWDDRMVSLVITEDEYGDSLVVLIFRG